MTGPAADFGADELSRDAFLGGALHLWQPLAGYRAGVDPVFLAAVVPAVAGQSVLELGCGTGAAILSLAVRVPGLTLTGVELQPAYADLARRNGAENDVDIEVIRADLTALPQNLRQRQFDHVIANPPYFRAGTHSPATDSGRQTALGEITGLADWIGVAARRLAPKGYLHVIQRSDRLPELLAAMCPVLGSVEVLPFAARTGRAPDLVILRARKNGRAAFRLHAPVIVHQGAGHDRDEESYHADIKAVLRDASAMHWPVNS